MKRCFYCGHELIQCPTRCTFRKWKHMDTGKHRCEYTRYTKLGDYRYILLTFTAYPKVN